MSKFIYLKLDACKECPYCNGNNIYAVCQKIGMPIININDIDTECPLNDSEGYDKDMGVV